MKPTDKDRLLREILADDPLEHLRHTTLSAGMAKVRHRRRVRMLLAGAAGSLVVAWGTVAVLKRDGLREANFAPRVETAASPRNTVKWIDDEQLLARFADRGVALIGRPGEQRLVFLELAAPSDAAHWKDKER